jgi:hypothetical protein
MRAAGIHSIRGPTRQQTHTGVIDAARGANDSWRARTNRRRLNAISVPPCKSRNNLHLSHSNQGRHPPARPIGMPRAPIPTAQTAI